MIYPELLLKAETWAQIAWIWPLSHFLIFLLILRRKKFMRSERNIFLWHAGSWTLLFLASGFSLWRGSCDGGPYLGAFLLGLSLHGIYSLSFLELWSLSQASYSLQLLAAKAQKDRADTPIHKGTAIGSQKLVERNKSLFRIGLITRQGIPSHYGKIGALICRCILWISGGKTLNT